SRLRFSSSKITPVLSASEAHDRILYSVREGSAVAGTLSLAAMESFIQKQEKLLEAGRSKAPEGEGGREAKESSPQEDTDGMGPSERGPRLDTDSDVVHPSSCGGSDLPHDGSLQTPTGVLCLQNCPLAEDSETALADLALDVLRLLLMDHWSWLCTENTHKVLHLLFGTLIQRWLEVQVVNLTCTQRWVQYLQLLQESIWPGGVLPAVPKPARTEEQKKATAEQALQSLMGILPNVVQEILGTSKCQMSWNLVLESLGQPVINRHLVFCLLDVLLEFLVLKGSSDELETAAAAPSAPSGLDKAGISAH
ncbi:PREDICTED: sorting nexin-19-like, partial [Leptosomus discolor]|uniref:sorting nexin-19-like n=1 Tax=Leptosomus discolor TaxID=188344 RepID=UPI000522C74C